MDSFTKTWFCFWGVNVVWLCNECDCSGGWIFLGISIGRLNHLLLLRSVYPLQRWNAALFTWAKVARKWPQLKRVVDHNGQQWHLLGFGDQPPKPDLQKGHTERSVETPSVCFVWIKNGWHFWELEGHLLKLVFFLNSLRPSPPSPPIGWKITLQQTETYPPHLPRKGKSEIHL